MLSPSLSKLELNTLREYQNLAINLMVLKDNLDKLNNDIDLNTIDRSGWPKPEEVKGLWQAVRGIQKESVLKTVKTNK